MKSKSVPKYCRQKDKNIGYCYFYDSDRKRRKKYFPGKYRSAVSMNAYADFIKQLSIDSTPALVQTGSSYRVQDLAAYWLSWCQSSYSQKEFKWCRSLIQPLLDGFASLPVDSFGPKNFKELRKVWIDAGNCRKTISRKSNGVMRMFKFGVEEEIVEANTYFRLKAVRPLHRGEAPDGKGKVSAVEWSSVEPVLSHVQPPVAAMIQVQWYTGMRSANLVDMRPCDIDTSESVWVYRPLKHKSSHRDIVLTIFVGPKAQQVLRPYLDRGPDEYCFSPKESVAAMNTARGGDAKTGDRYGWCKDKYDSHAYGVAVSRGVASAKVKPWTPHQLRHARATQIQRNHGIEAARVSLGHSNIATSEIYVDRDLIKAREIARVDG